MSCISFFQEMIYKLTYPYLEKEVFLKQGNYNYLSNVIYFIL